MITLTTTGHFADCYLYETIQKTGKTFCDLLVIRVLEMIGDIFPDALSGGYAVPYRIRESFGTARACFLNLFYKGLTERELINCNEKSQDPGRQTRLREYRRLDRKCTAEKCINNKTCIGSSASHKTVRRKRAASFSSRQCIGDPDWIGSDSRFRIQIPSNRPARGKFSTHLAIIN